MDMCLILLKRLSSRYDYKFIVITGLSKLNNKKFSISGIKTTFILIIFNFT